MFELRSALLACSILSTGVLMAQTAPIGSMTSAGDVMINALPAPPDITVFPGDMVRTGATGNATVTVSGRGSIALSPQSQVTLVSDARYIADLQSGAVVLDSLSGVSNLSLRAGTFVVGPASTSVTSSFQVVKMADGSFAVSCLTGNASLVPLQGTTGRVLQSNQSVNISSTGELGAMYQTPVSQVVKPATSNPSTAASTPPVATAAKSHKGLIILGVAGGGAAAGIAAAAAGHGGNSQPVSPSAP